jgi:hypothetical protein
MQPPGAIGTDIVFSSVDLVTYINSQRLAHGGDNILSFALQWDSDSCSACGMNDGIGFEDRENFGGSGQPPELSIPGPTAVTVSSFDVNPAVQGIQVIWATANEADMAGFNLYRATDETGPRTRLNADLIPTETPGQIAGSNYTYHDTTVQPGGAYYYWLEILDRVGYATDYGPLQATAPYVSFLPFMSK